MSCLGDRGHLLSRALPLMRVKWLMFALST